MSSTLDMVVTLTPQTEVDIFPSGDLVKVLHSGGAASLSQDHQEDPRRTGDRQIFDWIDLGHTGTWAVPAPMVFLGPWYHVEEALMSRHSDLVETLNDPTISFDAGANKIVTTTADGFAKYLPFKGMSIVISGSTAVGNNTGLDNFARILDVQPTEIAVDSKYHQLVTKAAGDAISLSVGYAIKDGAVAARRFAAEEGYLAEILAGDRLLKGATTFESRTTIAAVATGNKLVAPEADAAFDAFLPFLGTDEPVSIVGFSLTENQTAPVSTARLVSLATNLGNDELTLSGVNLADEAAGNPISIWLGGSFAQYLGLLCESFEITTSGDGIVDTSASYQVGEAGKEMTDRSLGGGSFLPHTGAGNPAVLSQHAEYSSVDGIHFRGDKLKSMSIKFENRLSFEKPDGAAGRKDEEHGKFMCSGNMEITHKAKKIHRLYQKQMATQPAQPVPIYRRWLDPLGNRIVVGVPQVRLKDGAVDKSGERALFKPNYNGKTDALLEATVFMQWIPAFA